MAIGALVIIALALLLAACSRTPVNSPYASRDEAQNVLYTAFTQRSPKYLDPASSYSTDETPFTYSIYEPLYGYHYLKRPYELIPAAAQAIAPPVYYDATGQRLPDDVAGERVAVSVYDIRIKPGILFAPHPAFARDASGAYLYWPLKPGQLDGRYALTDFPHTGTRELMASDYVYAFKRLASPRVVSPIYSIMAEHVIGMRELAGRLKQVDQSLKAEAGQGYVPWMDLRREDFEGVQALDAHTLRIKVKGKYPQFKYWLAMTFTAPVPWEADRFYHQQGMAEHNLSLNTWPAGTGPYMLVESIPNRRHVLARNPNYRGEPYPCEGAPGDREAGLLDDCGKKTPFVDRVVFSIEKESVPLMGKFIQGYYDLPQVERGEYGVAMHVAAGDSREKAALYASHGLQIRSATEPQMFYLGFNWLDPVVGGSGTPAQQEKNRKLRQAVSIAFDWEQFVSIFENDQAQVAYGPVPPGVPGYQDLPGGLNESVYTLENGHAIRKPIEEAKRLLAEAGYPDGRDARTGHPLILHFDSAGGRGSSAMLDWMRRQLGKIGVQLEVRATDYNRFQDKMRTGSAQLFMWGWVADYPDAENFLFLLYGPNAKASHGGENAANYQNPEYDRLFEQMRYLDDGPEKATLIHEMVDIVQRDAPWMFGYFPKQGGAYQPWVHNAKPTQMVRNVLQYLRIDPQLRATDIRRWNTPVWWPLWLLAGMALVSVVLVWRAARRRDRAVAVRPAQGSRQ
ncbi:peptide ABC transporter substrate-binding protein [Allopusillimonas soli]|uniref:ABC transporter substrate-binding protein n=1 Tax=Allopusillimonas soli TaxID=659016 RepID=A0A853FC32_9BURK|nr:ABC transporter substrate-binding protein [Allopusillimonas soli]NYT38345.1 ABC transporter substrate-binding protein [Allopusillimonas soli]TEA72242.1 peptide ABC transporter substrate-binding protein [Allopusillimonas soli]